jgi:hypothetical protein
MKKHLVTAAMFALAIVSLPGMAMARLVGNHNQTLLRD